MVRAIKRQYRVQWKNVILPMMVMVPCAWVFGLFVYALIVKFDKEINSCFPLGTLISAIMAVFFMAVLIMLQVGLHFNMEVSMGCTRKHFFVSYYLTNMTTGLLCVALLLGFNLLENALYSVIYPNLKQEIDLVPYLLKWGIPAAVILPVIAEFSGVLLLKFGKIASWIIWVFWMFLCIVGPQIQESVEEAPNSVYGKIGTAIADMVNALPGNVWVCIIGLASLFILAATWIILRKQQVTL